MVIPNTTERGGVELIQVLSLMGIIQRVEPRAQYFQTAVFKMFAQTTKRARTPSTVTTVTSRCVRKE